MPKEKKADSQSAEEMLQQLKSDLGIKAEKAISPEPHDERVIMHSLKRSSRNVMAEYMPPTDSKQKSEPLKPESSDNE